MTVRPKKFFGQHFLKDKQIANRIVDSLSATNKYGCILEVGPGMGVLTEILFEKYTTEIYAIDIDTESIHYLKEKFPDREKNIIRDDFLKMDLDNISGEDMGIIGNFPYNISSQIFFKILDYRNKVIEVVGMLQKEVAERITSGPGNRTYGILSVLLGAYFDIQYLFTVEPVVFRPKPKVRSAVIRLIRNNVEFLSCDEALFRKIVKEGFQKRRKTLRNALKGLNLPGTIRELPLLDKRAEQLSVEEFIELTLKIETNWKNSSHSN